jgi:sucrose phosphorylase
MQPPGVEPRPQLLTYPDSLGSGLRALNQLLEGPLTGLFRGVHILPPFPSSGDRGFAPITYHDIDPRFGTWADIGRLGEHHNVLLDLMINHISRQSPEFQDFQRHGRRSASADLFVTLDKVWPDGIPAEGDVARIFLRKPGSPFSTVTIEDTGGEERVWTSFGTADWSEQIDLDVTSPATESLITRWLRDFASHGVRMVRLDAVGYVIKKPGTSCFMVEPEIYTFLDWVTGLAASLGLVVLPEVHDVYATHERLASHGFWTYDFVLPALLLHTFHSGDSQRLAAHLAGSPNRQFTTLDSHDGIPVWPDLDGILSPSEMRALADRVKDQGGNVNRILSEREKEGVDVHQLNCTYYSALDCDDERYLAARAIQLFAKGVPQIYYVGLLAGENDHLAVEQTGEGRAINRRNYTSDDVKTALGRPVVHRLTDLVRLRRSHPAFDGEACIDADDERSLRIRWVQGNVVLVLEVDFAAGQATIVDQGQEIHVAAW